MARVVGEMKMNSIENRSERAQISRPKWAKGQARNGGQESVIGGNSAEKANGVVPKSPKLEQLSPLKYTRRPLSGEIKAK